MSKGKFALGALLGAGLGAVAGLLFAPKSGKETREDIKAKATDLKVKADKKMEEAKKNVDKTAKDVSLKAEDLKVRGEKAVEGAKSGFFDKK